MKYLLVALPLFLMACDDSSDTVEHEHCSVGNTYTIDSTDPEVTVTTFVVNNCSPKIDSVKEYKSESKLASGSKLEVTYAVGYTTSDYYYHRYLDSDPDGTTHYATTDNRLDIVYVTVKNGNNVITDEYQLTAEGSLDSTDPTDLIDSVDSDDSGVTEFEAVRYLIDNDSEFFKDAMMYAEPAPETETET